VVAREDHRFHFDLAALLVALLVDLQVEALSRRLKDRRITLVGCGAIGGYLAQALLKLGAGSGTGSLTLIDPDELGPGNLGRHFLGMDSLYKPKAVALRETLIRQFPHARIDPEPRRAAYPSDIAGDLVIDATPQPFDFMAVTATFEAMAAALAAGRAQDELTAYPEAFEKSWLNAELQQTRNFKLWFKKGKTVGQVMTGVEQWLLPKLGVTSPPWTLHNHKADHEALQPASGFQPIAYPKPDGRLSFDRLASVFVSNTNHEENQPAHLTLNDATVPVRINLAQFGGPESRYCPAGVYEFVQNADGGDRLQINAQNCVHCKTCDIKDPTQNIVWVTPEGGGGPNYAGM